MSYIDGPVLGLESCPGHERGALLGAHHPGTDLDALDAGNGLHVPLDISPKLIAKRAGGHRESDLHAHGPTLDMDAAHHSELDDVGAELGVYDAGESRPDGLVRRCTLAGRLGGRDRWVARHAHCMIEPTGAVPGDPRLAAPTALQEGDPQ